MMWQKRYGVELIAVIAMIAVVSVLAAYQYRWTGEISRTEQARLRNSLATSVRNFDQEFSYDFQQLCESFEIDPEAQTVPAENRIVRQYSNWKRTTSRPGIIVGVYIWKKTGDARASDLESLDPDREQFEKIVWPSRLESLPQLLERQLGLLSSAGGDREAIYYPWTFYENTPALI